MKKQVSIFHKASLFAASLCFLVACAGNKRPTQFYLLKSLKVGDLQQQPGITGSVIGIGPVSLPKYLDRPQIVTFTGDFTISISEFHQWAEPLQNNFIRVLMENLSALLPNSQFESYPWKSSARVNHHISVSIDHFDLNPESALLVAHWAIKTGTDGTQQNHNARIEKPIPDAQHKSKVSALSKLIALLSTEIAESIMNQHNYGQPR